VEKTNQKNCILYQSIMLTL